MLEITKEEPFGWPVEMPDEGEIIEESNRSLDTTIPKSSDAANDDIAGARRGFLATKATGNHLQQAFTYEAANESFSLEAAMRPKRPVKSTAIMGKAFVRQMFPIHMATHNLYRILQWITSDKFDPKIQFSPTLYVTVTAEPMATTTRLSTAPLLAAAVEVITALQNKPGGTEPFLYKRDWSFLVEKARELINTPEWADPSSNEKLAISKSMSDVATSGLALPQPATVLNIVTKYLRSVTDRSADLSLTSEILPEMLSDAVTEGRLVCVGPFPSSDKEMRIGGLLGGFGIKNTVYSCILKNVGEEQVFVELYSADEAKRAELEFPRRPLPGATPRVKLNWASQRSQSMGGWPEHDGYGKQDRRNTIADIDSGAEAQLLGDLANDSAENRTIVEGSMGDATDAVMNDVSIAPDEDDREETFNAAQHVRSAAKSFYKNAVEKKRGGHGGTQTLREAPATSRLRPQAPQTPWTIAKRAQPFSSSLTPVLTPPGPSTARTSITDPTKFAPRGPARPALRPAIRPKMRSAPQIPRQPPNTPLSPADLDAIDAAAIGAARTLSTKEGLARALAVETPLVGSPRRRRSQETDVPRPTRVTTDMLDEQEKVKAPETEDEKEASRRQVDNALNKIDRWADLWLSGKLAGDEDWKTFKHCDRLSGD